MKCDCPGEDGLWSGERPLGVDDPFGLAQRRERGVEGAPVGERGEVAEESEASGRMQGCEAVEEEAAEETRQHAHRQEEAGLAGDPARTVRRQAAAGNDDVDVRMMGERRAPGVEHGGEADARAQMLRVGGDRGQRLGRGPEQQVVDGGLVLERDGADRGRQGEDDVIVGNRQELGLAVFQPLPRRGRLTLRAMPVAAGVVCDALVRAVLAALDVSAERGSATGLDRRHDLQLGEAHVTGVGLSPRRPVGAKDVGDLQADPEAAPRGRGQPGGVFFVRLDVQPVQRTLDVADRVDGDAGVERSRLELGMAEQHLDHANIDALFEQVGRNPRVKPGECRSVCGETRLEIPARSLAAVTARLS